MSHANACLTPRGRLKLARCVVEDGWPLRRAAERFQVSVTTAQRWAARYRELGEAGMADRSCRPHRCPTRTQRRIERKIRLLRRAAGDRPVSPTCSAEPLHRAPCPHPLRTARLATATGPPELSVGEAGPLRTRRPGDLVHVDIKKLGNIPDGGGHDPRPGQAGRKNRAGAGYELPPQRRRRPLPPRLQRDPRRREEGDRRRILAAGPAFFTAAGITVERVLTDNGSCYRSPLAQLPAQHGISHKRTRPYRPQTNGKVERFNRTLLDEWAYATALPHRRAERRDAYPAWLHTYNHHRGHTALKGQPPASRVPNLTGQYT